MLTIIQNRFLGIEKPNGRPGSRLLSGAASWLLNDYRMLCLMGCGMAPIAACPLADSWQVNIGGFHEELRRNGKGRFE